MRLALALMLCAAAPVWPLFRTDGVSIRHPPSWDVTARPLTPVTSPAQVLAAASYRLPRGSSGADGCEPKEALDRMPPGGAFIYVIEYDAASLRYFPPRPKAFKLTGLALYECMGRSYMIRFREAGRFFQVHVAFGPRAGAPMRATALRVLDSFHAR